MEISGASSAAVSTSIAVEVQKKTEDVQAQNAATLIESVPEAAPQSSGSLGGTIDVNA